MPPEIDDHKPKNEQPLPLIDLFSFHQGSLLNDQTQGAKPHGSIEISDPFAYHQGLNSLAKVLNGDQAKTAARTKDEQSPAKEDKLPGGKTPDGYICLDGICRPMTAAEKAAKETKETILPANPFEFHQRGKASPWAVQPPRPFPDNRTPELPQPSKPADRPNDNPIPLKPGDRSNDNSNLLQETKSGKSAIVEAYERRQGARHAGAGGLLPAIDAIPFPGDLTPPSPGPRPDIAPWTQPKPDVNVKPADFRPEPSDLISKLEPKYETNDVATAVKMARDTGLPLAVHIGAQWCHYCTEMERNTWPSVEGTANSKGSMQGKMVMLHLDVDHAQSLAGDDAKFAREILRNRGGSVPLLRVFKVDSSGNLSKTAENPGAISNKTALENFLRRGGVSR